MENRVLIVDDDEAICRLFKRAMTEKGFQADTASSLTEARANFTHKEFDVVLLDMILPDGNGSDWIPDIREQAPECVIVVITGYGDVPDAVQAMKHGADHFLTKPVNLPELQVFLEKCLELRKLRRTSAVQERLVHTEVPYFGNSPRIRTLMNVARMAAQDKDAAIFIRGETGTGKGLLARWIHDHSPLSEQAFVRVHCSSLRGQQLRSELFGHVKGAFPAADADRMGLVEAANGGTLFIDEIGDMDLDGQTAFLQFLEQGVYRRMGEVKTRYSECRLVSATNQDLEKLIDKGLFRRDLYYRINVFPIEVPPLRDLRDDIPGLIRHILGDIRKEPQEVSSAVMEKMVQYSWPGNVREMKNVLERASLLAGDDVIQLRHCPGLEGMGGGVDKSALNLQVIEKGKIAEALEKCQFDVTHAAEALGISRATLYRKIKNYKLPRKPIR